MTTERQRGARRLVARWNPALVLLGVACGGGAAGGGSSSAAPVLSPSEAVIAFMRAAADSNVARMGELFGTSSGPVSRSEANEKRLVIQQAYLKGDSVRIVADEPVPGSGNQRRVMVALYRAGCAKQFPIFTVRAGDGWLVQNVDLNLTGNPARPCEP